MAASSILLGTNDIVVAGGMESMSQTPYYSTKQRFGSKYGHQELVDGIVKDGLTDAYKNILMGDAAELIAEEMKISRQEQVICVFYVSRMILQPLVIKSPYQQLNLNISSLKSFQ